MSKFIEVSDEDYETLMELSKELQLQSNDGNAFPYFWEPAHEVLEMNANDEGEETYVYDFRQAESYTLEEYAEDNEQLWYDYVLDSDTAIEGSDTLERPYTKEDESGWREYIEDHMGSCVRIYTQDWVQHTTHNPSLFKSDVKNFIETNKHHLGRNPHTYARTSFRMYKMEKLIECLYRLNKQPKELVNHEAVRFVYKENK